MSTAQKDITSSGRWILFHIIAIFVIPVLFLIFLETGLRCVGFGYDSHFLVPCQTKGCVFFKNNPDFTSQFFSTHLARSGFPVSVPYRKGPNTYRIFVLGESAAAGYPIPDFSFSRMLGAMLKTKYPDVNVEVINTSIVAINSHVILKIAQEITRYHPDMFILYIGNNEVVGPYGPGTVFAPFTNDLFVIRSLIYLKSTRIGQLIQYMVDHLGKQRSATPLKWEGMAMFSAKQIDQNDPRMGKVYQFYERNLNDIINVCLRSGAKVVLSTVGSNIRDIAPFSSRHDKPVGQQWDRFYEAAIQQQQAGHYKEAIEQFFLAARLDDSYAELQFRLGRCYEALGQFVLARQRYIKARDKDTLRFRADTRINEIIRKIASERKDEIAFVDSARNFEISSPHGLSGKEYFYEHVHMNFQGQYLLAAGLWPEVKSQLPSWVIKDQRSDGPVLSLKDCAQYLGYARLEDYIATFQVHENLMNRPPFTNILNHRDLMDDLKEKLDLGHDSIKPKGVQEAIKDYEYALKMSPQDPWTYYHLGRAYLLLKQPEKALVFLRYAVVQMPSLKDPYRLFRLAEKDLISKH